MDTATPKIVTRWKGGVPTRTAAMPTPFDQERAETIFQLCRAAARSTPWVEQLDKQMTDGEIAYVKALWDTMPGYTCFCDAFHRIRLGRV